MIDTQLITTILVVYQSFLQKGRSLQPSILLRSKWRLSEALNHQQDGHRCGRPLYYANNTGHNFWNEWQIIPNSWLITTAIYLDDEVRASESKTLVFDNVRVWLSFIYCLITLSVWHSIDSSSSKQGETKSEALTLSSRWMKIVVNHDWYTTNYYNFGCVSIIPTKRSITTTVHLVEIKMEAQWSFESSTRWTQMWSTMTPCSSNVQAVETSYDISCVSNSKLWRLLSNQEFRKLHGSF